MLYILRNTVAKNIKFGFFNNKTHSCFFSFFELKKLKDKILIKARKKSNINPHNNNNNN